MNHDLDTLRTLVATPQLLADVVAAEGNSLQLQAQLRKRYDPELVRAALSLVETRQRAQAKFSRASQMWLDRRGLEQSTSEAVAQHKARRFAAAGETEVLDLCCGIGADAVALAQAGLEVRAVDLSPLACEYTRLNAAAYGVMGKIETVVGDVREVDVAGQLVHLDPDRRASGRRALELDDYEPSLDFLRSLIETARGGAIKLSPASNFGGKFPGCEVELVSLHRECKEAVVWFGSLTGEKSSRATILPQGWTLTGDPWDARPRVRPLERFIYDPDPAIVRSGLLDVLVEKLEIGRLDDAEEYLTSAALVESPALAAFEVITELPHNHTMIRQYFRENSWGDVEIKARHVPVNVEQLRKKLPLSGVGRVTLFIARLQGKTRAVVAQRV